MGHPGRPLYERYRDELHLRLRLREAAREHVDAAFVATAVEVFLGREATLADHVRLGALQASELVRDLLHSAEFVEGVLVPLAVDAPFREDRYRLPLALRHRLWPAERLTLDEATAGPLAAADDWRGFVAALLDDPVFRRGAAMVRLMALVDGVRATGGATRIAAPRLAAADGRVLPPVPSTGTAFDIAAE